MNEQIDNKNIGLSRLIFDLKQSMDLRMLIGLNATKINKKAGKSFFGYVQKLALENIALSICKIFEKTKRNKINSITSIIDFINSNPATPKYSEQIESFIDQYGEKMVKKNQYGGPLKKILEKFKEDNKGDYSKFKEIRDSRVAHSQDMSEGTKLLVPSYDAMEKFLNFASEFYSMIHESFIGGSPVDHESDRKIFRGAITILEHLGHQNIKTEFND